MLCEASGGIDNVKEPSGGATAPRWRRALVVLLAIGLAGLAAWAIHARLGGKGTTPAIHASHDAAAVPVLAVAAEKRDVPIYLEGLGTVEAFNSVTVKPQVDGRLDEVLFREGQEVKKGDLLARIDARPFAIQLQEARAAQSRDSASARDARLTLDRLQALLQKGIATQQQVDDQRAVLATAEAALRGDDAQIASANLQLDYAQIKSPIDGVTGVRLVDAGNVVRASDANGIVLVTQVNPIAVMFTLPEDDLARAKKALAAGSVDVVAFARDGTKLAEGRVSLIDNQINVQTATIRLKAVFDNDQRLLWPNQFVNARMLLSTQKDALVVPAAAIVHGPDGTMVYVVGTDDTVKTSPVAIDTTQGDIVVLRSGVAPGDRVVTEGQYQLKPGSKVSIRPAGTATSSAAGTPAR